MPTLYEVSYTILCDFQFYHIGDSLSVCVEVDKIDSLDKIEAKAYKKICRQLKCTDLVLRFDSMKVV